MREDRADHERVVGLEAALQRLAQRGELRAQPALGQLGEHARGRSCPTTSASSIARPDSPRMSRGDAVELDAGVLERLVQPVGLALALGDLRLAIAGQRPQPPLRLGRHEAAAQQPGLHQLAQPLRVADVGLAARHVLDVAGVAQRQLEVVLEHVPDRLPIDAGGLHRHVRDRVRGQPVAQRDQALHGGRELGQMRLAPPGRVRARARTPSPAPCAHRARRRAQRSSPS